MDLSKFSGNTHVRRFLVIRNTTNAEMDVEAVPLANLSIMQFSINVTLIKINESYS